MRTHRPRTPERDRNLHIHLGPQWVTGTYHDGWHPVKREHRKVTADGRQLHERHRREAQAERPKPTEAPEASRVYERGQTVVPKRVRDALSVEQGSTLVWQVQDSVAQVIAIPKDPVRALRGILEGKGPTFEEFLADRNAERQRERELEADEERRWRTYSTRQH